MFWKLKNSMKGKYYAFSGYKQRNTVWLAYLECELQQQVWLIHFPVKIPENGRKNISREKKAINKVPLMFLDVKVLTET